MQSKLSIITSRIEGAYKAVDQEMASLKKACEKGCASCCHQITDASSWEALKIIEYIHKRIDSNTQSILRHNVEEWFWHFNNATKTSMVPITPDEMKRVEHVFQEKRVACPMLIENSCAIYDVRPISCRVHIEESDPQICLKNPQRITTFEARRVFKNSLSAFDPEFHPFYMQPIAYAVAGELRVNVKSKKIAVCEFGQ